MPEQESNNDSDKTECMDWARRTLSGRGAVVCAFDIS